MNQLALILIPETLPIVTRTSHSQVEYAVCTGIEWGLLIADTALENYLCCLLFYTKWWQYNIHVVIKRARQTGTRFNDTPTDRDKDFWWIKVTNRQPSVTTVNMSLCKSIALPWGHMDYFGHEKYILQVIINRRKKHTVGAQDRDERIILAPRPLISHRLG